MWVGGGAMAAKKGTAETASTNQKTGDHWDILEPWLWQLKQICSSRVCGDFPDGFVAISMDIFKEDVRRVSSHAVVIKADIFSGLASAFQPAPRVAKSQNLGK